MVNVDIIVNIYYNKQMSVKRLMKKEKEYFDVKNRKRNRRFNITW